MTAVILECESIRAALAPDVGGALADLYLSGPGDLWYPLLRPSPGGLSRWVDAAMFVMAPWANRIAGPAFSHRGATHRLQSNEPNGTALHGAVLDAPFRVVDRTPHSAVLRYESRSNGVLNWPWPLEVTVRHEVRPRGYRCDLSVRHLGEAPAPLGGGFHPWFCRGLWADGEDVEVRAPVRGEYPSRERLPTGEAAPSERSRLLSAGGGLSRLNALSEPIDTVLDGFAGEMTLRYPKSGATLRVRASENLHHLVLYAPRHAASGRPLSFVCLEPISHAVDALNAPADVRARRGVREFSPGETFHCWIEMAAEVDAGAREVVAVP